MGLGHTKFWGFVYGWRFGVCGLPYLVLGVGLPVAYVLSVDALVVLGYLFGFEFDDCFDVVSLAVHCVLVFLGFGLGGVLGFWRFRVSGLALRGFAFPEFARDLIALKFL